MNHVSCWLGIHNKQLQVQASAQSSGKQVVVMWWPACPNLPPLAVIMLLTSARGQRGAVKACGDYQRLTFLAAGQSAVKMGHSW